jgi:Na+/H+ antiporter NhaA
MATLLLQCVDLLAILPVRAVLHPTDVPRTGAVAVPDDDVAGRAALPDEQSRPRRRVLLAQLTSPLRSFLLTEAGSAGMLLAAAVVALVWANSPWSDAYESLWSTEAAIRVGSRELSMDIGHWVNDGLMALFFFVIGLEVRRELSIGELTDRRRLVVPASAAAGGILVPALLYLLVNPSGEAANGWGIVIGTDTAFLLGALAIVGPACPTQLRVFLLTLTVFDDAVAVTIIGLAYSDALEPVALLVAAGCLASLALLSRRGEWRASIFLVIGVALWVATVESGLHPSIAGMVAGLVIAARPPARQAVESAASLFRAFRQSPLPEVGYSAAQGLRRAVSVNERLQTVLHPWTSYVVVPLFALANAGVDLRGGLLADAMGSAVTWGVVLGLVVGKLAGIGAGALGPVRLRLGRLPQGVGEGQVVGGAALSGIGFTVSLLIASLAFSSAALRDQATVGVLLAAIIATVTGWVVFRLAALLRGERTASLPMVLDRPVDAAHDHVRGPADAPLTLLEYGDFECPFCGRATGVVRELRERFGNELRYVFRQLPLTDVHPHAELAARASEAAAAQGRFWEMHDLLFAHQDELELEDLVGYAAELGLDVEQFARDLDNDRFAERIRQDVASAEASGARGTPTFFVANRRHIGPYDAGTLARELTAPNRPLTRESADPEA